MFFFSAFTIALEPGCLVEIISTHTSEYLLYENNDGSKRAVKRWEGRRRRRRRRVVYAKWPLTSFCCPKLRRRLLSASRRLSFFFCWGLSKMFPCIWLRLAREVHVLSRLRLRMSQRCIPFPLELFAQFPQKHLAKGGKRLTLRQNAVLRTLIRANEEKARTTTRTLHDFHVASGFLRGSTSALLFRLGSLFFA